MLANYSDILRLHHAWKFSLAGFILRLPMSLVGISTILLVKAEYGNYTLAGAVSAANMIALAVGAPILNIHPSLLPSFPGMRAQMQAIAAGVRISGATVHFVDAGLDSGPILAQAAVPVSPHDTEQTLSARILEVEHRIYPETVDMVARGAYRIQGNRVIPA